MSTRAYVAGAAAFGLIILVAVVGSVALAETYSVNERPYSETATVTAGNNSSTFPADNHPSENGYFDNETVTNSSGDTLTEGIDYEFYANGTLTWYVNSPSVNDGENMTVNASYQGVRPTTGVLHGMHPLLLELLIFLALVVFAVVGIAGPLYGLHKLLTRSSTRRRY